MCIHYTVSVALNLALTVSVPLSFQCETFLLLLLLLPLLLLADCTGTSSDVVIDNQYLNKCNDSEVYSCGRTSVQANALFSQWSDCSQPLELASSSLVRRRPRKQ